jgi:hypothetical protein
LEPVLDRVDLPTSTEIIGHASVSCRPRAGGQETCQHLHDGSLNLGFARLFMQELMHKDAINRIGQASVLPVLVEASELDLPKVLLKPAFDKCRREDGKVNSDPLTANRLTPDLPPEELQGVIQGLERSLPYWRPFTLHWSAG